MMIEGWTSSHDPEYDITYANEGPMPQTRYVLMRALKIGLRPIVVVNKVDRSNSLLASALDKTFDLFIELGATDQQCDFPVLYGSGLNGWMVKDLSEVEGGENKGMKDLFETIIDFVPPPETNDKNPFLMQVSTLTWSDYLGRIARSEEHTSELQSRENLVCRLLLEKKKCNATGSCGWLVYRF